ncbi:hypothetical protein ACFL38_02165 [Candidatus Omnitrophota bacterium]
MRKALLILCSLFLAVSFVCPRLASGEYIVENMEVIASTGYPLGYGADLYEDYLVYADASLNIVILNIATGENIDMGVVLGFFPVIYGNKVVYLNVATGNIDIYDITTGETSEIAGISSFVPWDMYGNYVLLSGGGAGGLLLLDINTEATTDIVAGGTPAKIHGSNVVYIDSSFNLHHYDITTGSDTVVVPDVEFDADELDLDQNRVVFRKNNLIYIHYLDTHEEIEIDPTIEIFDGLHTIPTGYLRLLGNKLIYGVSHHPNDLWANIVYDINDSTKAFISEQEDANEPASFLDGNNFVYWVPTENHVPYLENLPGFVLAQLQLNEVSLIAPTGLAAVDSGTYGAVELSWNPHPSPDLAGYIIEYGTESGVYPDSITLEGNITGYHMTGLINDQEYFIVLKAYDTEDNQSPPSEEVSVTPTEMTTDYGQALAYLANAVEELMQVIELGFDYQHIIDGFFNDVRGPILDFVYDVESFVGPDNVLIIKAIQAYDDAIIAINAGEYVEAMHLLRSAYIAANRALGFIATPINVQGPGMP